MNRPDAWLDGDGGLVVESSATTRCRRYLWYTAVGEAQSDPLDRSLPTNDETVAALLPAVLQQMRTAGWPISDAGPVNCQVGRLLATSGRPAALCRMALPGGGGQMQLFDKEGEGESDEMVLEVGASGSTAEIIRRAALNTLGTFGAARPVVIAKVDPASFAWEAETIPLHSVEALLEDSLARLGRLGAHHALTGGDRTAPPPRDCPADSAECGSCPFRTACWSSGDERTPLEPTASDTPNDVDTSLIDALRQNVAVLNELTVRYGIGLPSGRAASKVAESLISCPRDVAELVGAEMSGLPQEQLRVLLLSTQNGVVGQEVVYKGTVNSIDIRIAEIIRPAVVAGAPAFIVVHNHPSGDPEPSGEDLMVTSRLVAAARLLEIAMLDHIVVGGPDSWVSMRQRGLTAFNSEDQAASTRTSRLDGYATRG